MKTIPQLLELTRNKFYKFTSDEKRLLDDFLSEQREKTLEKSQKTDSKKSSKKTRATAKDKVRVKNIVDKTDTGPTEVS